MTGKIALPVLGQPDPNTPGEVHLVGRYAVGVTWADGHRSIYPFERLRRGCPCGACATLAELTPEAVWPRAITRTAEGLAVTWNDGHRSLYPYASLRGRCLCAACTGGH